ncbi:MAG: tRNA (pseudouridine(54)-N(1))-methyltransferase TrmY [Candidatus Aenigmatarchaeota archaeon]
MREFVLRALKAPTYPDFNLSDLPGAGRIDLVCRCISNALWISNDLRRDTIIYVVMEGLPSPPKIITFYGEELKGLSPDERNIASHIKLALKKGLELKLNEESYVWNGIKIVKRSFESLVKEKAKESQLIYLHPKGKDIREFEFKRDVCFVLGDHIGIPRKTEKLLDRIGAERISLGPKVYLASHCITIVNYELDRRLI